MSTFACSYRQSPMWASPLRIVPARCGTSSRRVRALRISAASAQPGLNSKPLTKTELRSLPVVKLRAELQSRSLSAEGKKDELVERLLAASSGQPAEATAARLAPAEAAEAPAQAAPTARTPQAPRPEERASRAAVSPSTPPQSAPRIVKTAKREGGFDRVQAVRGKGLLNHERKGPLEQDLTGSQSDEPGYTGMEIEFLGTSSGQPTLWRNVSSLGMRFPGENWLFDCGEGTQHRLMVSTLSYPKITRIFITHTHGDHIFGLPGVIASISAARTLNSTQTAAAGGKGVPSPKTPLYIYGPPGLHSFLQGALAVSHTVMAMPLIVHEFTDRRWEPPPPSSADGGSSSGVFGRKGAPGFMPSGPPGKGAAGRIVREEIMANVRLGTVPNWSDWDRHVAEGRPLPAWRVLEDSNVVVYAAPLRHRVPCVGYVVEEKPWMGHLDVGKAVARGLEQGRQYAVLKLGVPVENPKGEIVQPEDVIGPPRPGRKICVLGDTCDSRGIEEFARHADLLVHESTFQNALKPLAERAGHSTAGMAGAFARQVQARRLLLTHFSNRYPSIRGGQLDRFQLEAALAAAEGWSAAGGADGDAGVSADPEADKNAINGLVREAAAEMGRGAEAVTAAYDLLRVAVARKQPEEWPPGVRVPSVAELAALHPNSAPPKRAAAIEQARERGRGRERSGSGGGGGREGDGEGDAEGERAASRGQREWGSGEARDARAGGRDGGRDRDSGFGGSGAWGPSSAAGADGGAGGASAAPLGPDRLAARRQMQQREREQGGGGGASGAPGPAGGTRAGPRSRGADRDRNRGRAGQSSSSSAFSAGAAAALSGGSDDEGEGEADMMAEREEEEEERNEGVGYPRLEREPRAGNDDTGSSRRRGGGAARPGEEGGERLAAAAGQGRRGGE